MVSLCSLKISFPFLGHSANLLHSRSPFHCASSALIIGSVSHPVETGLLIPSGKSDYRTSGFNPSGKVAKNLGRQSRASLWRGQLRICSCGQLAPTWSRNVYKNGLDASASLAFLVEQS